MADYIIYHAIKEGVPCPDGLAAAWVASKKYPGYEVVGAVHNEPCPITPAAGDKVLIVDFSYPSTVLNQWAADGVEVSVIDHHKTAMEDLSGLSDRISSRFNMDECGATLVWKTFFPDEPVPLFLEYIRDRDLWQHKIPGTREVHAAYQELGRSFELYDELAVMGATEFMCHMFPLGKPIIEARDKQVAETAQRAEGEFFRLPKELGFADNSTVYIKRIEMAKDGSEDYLVSDVCSYLNRSHSPVFTLAVCSDGTCSLRSDRDGSNFDVGALAKVLGGGGHRNAAGYKSKEDKP